MKCISIYLNYILADACNCGLACLWNQNYILQKIYIISNIFYYSSYSKYGPLYVLYRVIHDNGTEGYIYSVKNSLDDFFRTLFVIPLYVIVPHFYNEIHTFFLPLKYPFEYYKPKLKDLKNKAIKNSDGHS